MLRKHKKQVLLFFKIIMHIHIAIKTISAFTHACVTQKIVAKGYIHTLLLFYEKYRDCSSRLSEVFAFKKLRMREIYLLKNIKVLHDEFLV
jgi:hypothetical protein